MDVDTDDPALLFTPQRPKFTSNDDEGGPSHIEDAVGLNQDEDVEAIDATPNRDSETRTRDVFSHISPPALSPDSRETYQILHAEDSSEEETPDILEIVGEYNVDGTRYLYARHDDNIVRRKEYWKLKQSHPDLYDQYKLKKSKGKRVEFDPSATYVLPKHRIVESVIVTSRGGNPRTKRGTRSSRAASADNYISSDSEPAEAPDSSEDEDDEDDQDYDGIAVRRAKPRAAKNKKMKQSKLPFSPRKTRLGGRQRRAAMAEEQDDDDEEQDEEEQEDTRRRSSRNKTGKDRVQYNENGRDDDEDEDFDLRASSRSQKKTKRRLKKRGPKPAYGVIRNVEDLEDSDEETAPLRAHRDICEKCKDPPSHILIAQAKRKAGRKRKVDEDEESDGERASKLGGWVRCLKCCIAAHWRCLARNQQDEILKAAKAKDAEKDDDKPQVKRTTLQSDESTEFLCGACTKGGACFGCNAVVLEPEIKKREESVVKDVVMAEADDPADDTNEEPKPEESDVTKELLFRCVKCKRLAHYAHLLENHEGLSLPEIAMHFQLETEWQCGDCASYTFHVEKILAWRPYPANAAVPQSLIGDPPNYKDNLPREYLVKWDGRSYRRAQWVPHMWLSSTAPAMLKNFLATGTKVELLPEPFRGDTLEEVEQDKPTDEAELPAFATKDGSRESSSAPAKQVGSLQPVPLVNAEDHIPPRWKTVDRVLDVRFWFAQKSKKPKAKKKKGKGKPVPQLPEESDEASSGAEEELERAFINGDEPSAKYLETIDEFENRTDEKVNVDDVDKIVWAFIKWDDLTYDESSWDSPPREDEFGYAAFKEAFAQFLASRSVTVPKLSKNDEERRERRYGHRSWSSERLGVPEDGVYDIGQSNDLKLMDFQVNGVNWLCRNWYLKQQCILADEMGLGKTVQIVTFLGLLKEKMGVFPSLVVVPNSTITNWVREFNRWAPHLRVVPFYGEQNARAIIKQYELFHENVAQNTTGAKFHVLVTTYDTAIAQKEIAAVFKRIPRWEVLVVDEGQRLKGDSSLLFKRLTEMNTKHRVLMTGTPLNNNIRELFNLMHFLDPEEWNDLDALAERFEDLDDARVKDLHEMLRPYFLRRVKADVLKLPPKNEVIVPISMAPLQKEIYKSLLSKNLTALTSLTSSNSSIAKTAIKKSNLNNLLMQLRKCLQHPYTISSDIEPKGLTSAESHSKLIDACGKLRLLKTLLPRLKARGHRVLLFSQFKLALDIIEDFLVGEGYKFLRLDGDTKQQQRQKDMDEFNREGSDTFLFLLTTRAGGVGINLWSADTVIIFDPDFNPHQDLQAIARAHRFGQTKTCLVFKLMTKGSCEEKIFQAGKKKLVLDHLIVQKMDTDDDAADIQSILTYGASDLFNEDSNDESKNIHYSEQDVDNLIERTEKEGDNVAEESSGNNDFAFAKIWSLHKEDVEELQDDSHDQDDAWTQTLTKMVNDQKLAEKVEKTGRGARRKATLAKTNYFEADASPEKQAANHKRKSVSRSVDSEDEYQDAFKDLDSENESPASKRGDDIQKTTTTLQDTTTQVNIPLLAQRPPKKQKKKHVFGPQRPLSPSPVDIDLRECGLCDNRHKVGACTMTQTPANLAEYRLMLINHTEDESYEERVDAINAIDSELASLGMSHLIKGQPIRPIRRQDEPSLKMIAFNPKPSAPSRKMGDGKAAWRENVSNLSTTMKRPSDATPESVSTTLKKAKLEVCAACKSNHATLEECPVVKAGPKSIASAINKLLNDDGDHSTTVKGLRKLLFRARNGGNSGPNESNPTALHATATFTPLGS